MRKYISSLFFNRAWYIALCVCAVLFLVRFFIAWLGIIPYLAVLIVAVAFCFEYIAMFLGKGHLFATRTHAERLSNGDENIIRITLQNFYNFPVKAEVIDELPVQFQIRDNVFLVNLSAAETRIVNYELRPVKRGEYQFGKINLYASAFFGLLKRRFVMDCETMVPVYPSYIQMRKFQLLAIHNRLTETGIKRLRRIGHSMEFEQVMEYVPGDDQRTVNWKATARKGQLMVNHYTDEKSQQIYCIIDKGRLMKMPFHGLSLLDYAINTSLVLSNIALLKQDKAGLMTFSDKMGKTLIADKKSVQMQYILEMLYHQKTRFLESDFERLYVQIRKRISQRSLIVLFTNFESLTGLQRQLPYLRKIARNHL
ncbi:MAG: DUF58 domain-containing protein, partial [Chitinophagaceae bacterium]